MNRALLATISMTGLLAIAFLGRAPPANAVECAQGVYRAGCAGPNGAAMVRKPVDPPHAAVTCARGVYRAGCAGPNGAAVVRRPY